MLNDVLNHDKVYSQGVDLFFMYNECFMEDLVILYSGYKNSIPGDFYGPATRDHFVYYHILEGKATFETMFESYSLDAGCSFLTFPNEQVKYTADIVNPAVKFRLGFKGKKAVNIVNTAAVTVKTPVMYHTDKEQVNAIMNGFLLLGSRDSDIAIIEAHALFYKMISFWAHENKLSSDKRKSLRHSSIQDEYLAKALSYIELNYNKNIQVSHIAEHLNINASYFSRIFKNAYHITASSYLQWFRLEAAKNLLANSALTVNQIAVETGFDDSTYFISVFKKKFNITPKQYREDRNKPRDS